MKPRKKRLAAKSSNRALVMTRTFAAPRSRVFAAWINSKDLKRWSAPNGFTLTVSEGDAHSGGKWRACMRSPEGEELRLGGVYEEIVPNERLVFTHAWEEGDGPGTETCVRVRLVPAGRKTKMYFRQSGFTSVTSRNGHQGGWSECFERLAALLAR